MSKDPLKMVEQIIEKVGKPRATRLLIEQEISPSMASQLVRGKYESEIRALYVAAIERAREAAGQLSDAS
jgi:hypothetical protein